MYEFTTQSGADTIEVGRKLVRLLEPPQLLLLRGELGTGKTTLVKGIAEALDAAEADEVTSPTFTLLHEYNGTRDGKPISFTTWMCIALKVSGNWRHWAWMSC